MAPPVKFRIRDHVAIVTLAAPPANAISAEVRTSLWDVFGRINDNEAAQSAILIGEGALFSGGAEIRSLGAPEGVPSLSEVCRRIETARVPVVAGLHGAVLGAGADLALACHMRLAAEDASIGLPEITLGSVPSGGATQRLPRLVGAETALDLLLSGRSLPARLAIELGLIDGLVQGHLHTGVWNHARGLAEKGTPPEPVCDRTTGIADGPSFMAAIADRRGDLANQPFFAPGRIVDCVEAALLLPFEAGLQLEVDAADQCRTNPQARALRHVFMSERRVDPRVVRVESGKPVPVEPAGTGAVSRLRHVFGAVAEHLRGQGVSPEIIDKALIDYGFSRTPYSGSDGGAGADGPVIARRFVTALMVEGARLMSRRAVLRPGDVDVLAVCGLGFPRHHGGPMKAAEIAGLLGVKKDLAVWGTQSPLWETPNLVLEALKTADGFEGIELPGAA